MRFPFSLKANSNINVQGLPGMRANIHLGANQNGLKMPLSEKENLSENKKNNGENNSHSL